MIGDPSKVDRHLDNRVDTGQSIGGLTSNSVFILNARSGGEVIAATARISIPLRLHCARNCNKEEGMPRKGKKAERRLPHCIHLKPERGPRHGPR